MIFTKSKRTKFLKILAMNVLCLYFCQGAVFADTAATNPASQGNQGYVYGSAPKDQDNSSTTSTTGPNPVVGIVNAIWAIDVWIRQNLW